MQLFKSILAFLIILCLGALWGSLQSYIFPIEQFGIICYFSSFIGGIFIGYFGMKIFFKYFDK